VTTPVITIIGAGNMGSSLIGGLIKDGHPGDKLWACDPSKEKCLQVQETFQVHTTPDNAKAVEHADVIIFAVKPQVFKSIAKSLASVIQQRKPLIISIAAGVRESHIQHWLGGNMAIVRSMPNTPALIGCGATALYANQFVSVQQRNIAESILRAVGMIVWLNDEHLMDTVTALSGSGPAYFFLIMEIMQHTAEQLGLTPDTARLLTLQTALGAARMAMESGKSLDELRHNVTSPGGTTEKAISVLEENNIRSVLKKALHAAKLRSEELAELMEKT
jgi:pyrroline-5-carboxylate reductase